MHTGMTERHSSHEVGRLAEAFRDHLDHAFAEAMTLERFAALHRVRETALRAAFVHLTGRRPPAYLIERRLAAAAVMLATTSEKVDTVARAVGWRSRKNFNRALARATGESPSHLRRPDHPQASPTAVQPQNA